MTGAQSDRLGGRVRRQTPRTNPANYAPETAQKLVEDLRAGQYCPPCPLVLFGASDSGV
jgi:hypothetical protein